MFARTVTERKVHLALREKLFPCGRLRAEPSQKQAFPKATAGCANQRVSVLADRVGERKPNKKRYIKK